jgi:hypothetical protein
MLHEPVGDQRHWTRRAIPLLWLAMSMVWAVEILITDQLAWPLALWIATTLGPLTALQARNNRKHSGNQIVPEPTKRGEHR